MANTSQLAKDMAGAILELNKKLSGGATDEQIAAQIHTIVDPQLKTLGDALAEFKSKEDADEDDIQNLVAAVSTFTTAFAAPTTGDDGTGASS